MSLVLSPDDNCLTWQGAVSLERTGNYLKPWRIPYQQYDLFPPDGIDGHAAETAGVRIAFCSNTTTVAGRIVPFRTDDPRRIDLCIDGELYQTLEFADAEAFRFDSLPAGEKTIEIWLPQCGQFALWQIELDDGATVTPVEDRQPRWITYGSSITQCATAESPAQTWPAIVSRKHGLNLTCLGFGGNCHLEPMVARLIRDLPADFISMAVGINIYIFNSLSPRTFLPAIIGFVKIIREKHATTPLVLVSPIYNPDGEATANAVDFNLQMMRRDVATAVDILRADGDGHIHYIDGLDLLGPDLPNWSDLVPDGLHPNAEGYKVLAEIFLEKVAAKIFI